VAGEHGQHDGAETIAVGRRIGTHARERTVGDERIEQARNLQELDEDSGLHKRRQWRLRVPFDLDLTGPAVDGDRPGRTGRRGRRRSYWLVVAGLTRRVSGGRRLVRAHPPEQAHLLPSCNTLNCRM
jgi:hypothetical protein